MNRYLQGFADYMADLARITKDEPNPHRQAIMRNYTRHHAVEFAGTYQHIFTPEMSVERPIYHVKLFSPEVVIYDGVDELDGLYQFVGGQPLVLTDARIAVGDWGVASHEHLAVFFPGRALAEMGVEVDDPNAVYIRECELVEFWPYNSDAKLLGEDVYQITPDTITKASPDDIITMEQQAEIARQYVDI